MRTNFTEEDKKNLGETFLDNVSVQEASADHLPFPESSFDVVISNGVINLVPDKTKARAKVFRVLKPGGWLMIADQILAGQLPTDPKARLKTGPAEWAVLYWKRISWTL
jgi:arsenite methyltransferase